MRIVRLHPEDPNNYCCNLYWILAGTSQAQDLNTLVDAGSSHPGNLEFLLRRMEEHPKGIGKRAVEQVILTHAHYDHVGGLPALIEQFQPKVYAYRREPGVDHEVVDGTWLRLGNKDFRVLHTPGHSADSICLFCPETGILFSGDTLYRISDTSGSYPECYVQSLERLNSLDIRVIHPGHGESISHGIHEFISKSIENVRGSLIHHG